MTTKISLTAGYAVVMAFVAVLGVLGRCQIGEYLFGCRQAGAVAG
ncbi:hypothetical protein EV192_102892 [Actinocrispum wychmicini]|uniref:Uncharacterized protein n=1 Tax=Actinocrispum wychmicini TaxID=1213861 RepID=A0A4R2JR67_9PSEU|nr:hypothetical protein EV192_102892 [Actinocrispum wychmicini]